MILGEYPPPIDTTIGSLCLITCSNTNSSLREHPSTQVLIDLWIARGILFFIMILDNQRNGRSFRKVVPFAIITFLLGSIGPLLYFMVYSNLLKSKDESRY